MAGCGVCGCNPREYTGLDIAGTLRSVEPRLRWTLESVPSEEQPALVQPMGDGVHEIEHGLHELGRRVHGAGFGAPAQVGRVVQLNVSGGGVPKRPVTGPVAVGRRGLEGDRQEARKHHGRPWQAICLWSADMIGALQAEGHPVGCGSAGENVTVEGVDWSTIRPGVLLGLGPDVVVRVSSYAIPCKKNAQWFADRAFDRIDHDTHRGWSRVYASVLRTGSVAAGDEVVVEPQFPLRRPLGPD